MKRNDALNLLAASASVAAAIGAAHAASCPPEECGEGQSAGALLEVAPTIMALRRGIPGELGAHLAVAPVVTAPRHADLPLTIAPAIEWNGDHLSLALSLAAAQQEKESHETHVQIIRDGDRIEIRRSGDEISAVVNGENVPDDRVRVDGGTVVILGESGEEVIRLGLSPGAFAFSGHEGAVEVAPPRGMIGVQLGVVDASIAAQVGVNPEDVVVIADVIDDMPAQKAGIQQHDIVVAINGKKPVTDEILRKEIAAREPGESITLRILRKGESRDVKVEVAEARFDVTASVEGAVEAPSTFDWFVHADPGSFDVQEYTKYFTVPHLRRWMGDEAAVEELHRRLREELGRIKIDDEVRKQIEEAIRNALQASRHAVEFDVNVELPQIELFRGEGPHRGMVVVPPPPPQPGQPGAGARTPRAAGDLDARFDALEERMQRLESLLEDLIRRDR
jgi:hypothetical protein